ncbi:hypothetical protein EK904_004354 [Melospiza melodia maxima]|nr:hypothetical protein EK904_004354 [Melospiza melodia maxima]
MCWLSNPALNLLGSGADLWGITANCKGELQTAVGELKTAVKLHLIHAFPRVPVEKGFPPEHGRELLGHPDEELLDGCVIANKRGCHLQPSRRDVTHGHLHVVRDPLHKVGAVLGLDRQQLLVHFLGGHSAPEDAGHGEVAPAAGVARCHHVPGVEHLLGELWHRQGPVLLAAPSCQRGKAGHEEVQARKGHHVHRQLAQIRIQLAGEAQRGGDAAHGEGHQVVEVPIGGIGELQCPEANIIESLVVNAEGFIGVLYQLVDGEDGVVRLHHRVRHLGGGHDAEGVHDPVGIFLSDLVDEERPHA